ncbi:MAG: hypothetical protein C4K49_12930 [Candidatus Thorarchaeota archaeon]|nr:MAG: hypothetical protein C4K49_12930 [Candidatus Thorarchaeota archaeon]
MSTVIDEEWKNLFQNNPKIQAFAVCRDGTILWQTSNWSLVEDGRELTTAAETAAASILANGVKYSRIASSPGSYVATSQNNGHFLMALVEGKTWLMAWATADSVPELAAIDVSRTALKLIGRL